MKKRINITCVQASPYNRTDMPQAFYLDGKLFRTLDRKFSGKEIIQILKDFPKEKDVTYTNDPHMFVTTTDIPDIQFLDSLDEMKDNFELRELY